MVGMKRKIEEKSPPRRWGLGKVAVAGFGKPVLQMPILASGAIGGKYVW